MLASCLLIFLNLFIQNATDYNTQTQTLVSDNSGFHKVRNVVFWFLEYSIAFCANNFPVTKSKKRVTFGVFDSNFPRKMSFARTIK